MPSLGGSQPFSLLNLFIFKLHYQFVYVAQVQG